MKPERAGECVNLRPDKDSGEYLEPVPAPSLIDQRPWRVIGVFIEDNENVVELLADGGVLGACVHGAGADVPQPYIVADWLEGEITDSYRCSDGYMILTDKAMYRAVYDGSAILRCMVDVSPADYPVIGIEVISETSMSLAVESFRLSGNYGDGNVRLQAGDAVKLKNAMYDAYVQGAADASADGQYISPVLARYRLFDSVGDMLMESMPVLLVATGRHDRSMTALLSVDADAGNVMAGAVSVPLFKAGVKVPSPTGSIAGQRVSRIEIQVTPSIHCADGNLTAVHRLERSLNKFMLQATMPGCDPSGKGTSRYRREIRRALRCCESLFGTVMTIEDPFSPEKTERTLQLRPVARSVQEEKSMLSRAVAENDPHWLTRCMLPHTVSGKVSRRDGETVVMGNLGVRLFPGHPVEYYVNHGHDLDNIETVSSVTFEDGRRVVSRGGGYTWKSMMLSPLVVYPDCRARSISFQVIDSDGMVSGMTLPLEPCGRFACSLAEDVWPVELVPMENEMPVTEVADQMIRYPGNVIVYKGDMPGEKIAGKEIGMGCINAIHPVGRPSSSAWESSRARYNLMGSDGIFSLSMNGDRPATPVRLDSRPVVRRDAVAAVSGGKDGVTVYAIAGNDMVAVSGNKVMTVAREIDADMLVWNSIRAELLAIPAVTSGGGISRGLVYHIDCAGWSMRLLPGISAAYSSQTVSRITSSAEGAVYDLCRETGGPVRCRYTGYSRQAMTHPVRGVPFLNEITVDITCENIDGTVTVEGHHGRGPWCIFSRFTVAGQVNRPLCCHLMMPPRRCIMIIVDAVMSTDGRLGSINFYENDHV